MKFINYISIVVGKFVSWFFLLTVIITGYEVTMRYIFNQPTIWVFDLSLALSSAAIILSGAYVMKKEDHISITSIQELLPKKIKKKLKKFNQLFCSVICLLVAWAGFKFGIDAIAHGETTGGSWDAPIPAIIKPMITISAILMCLQSLVNFFKKD